MRQFEGVLAYVDCASDSAPSGAHGHRLILTKEAVEQALPTLIGKPINCCKRLSGHEQNVIGMILDTSIDRKNRIRVRGVVDPTKLSSRRGLGMSFEAEKCRITDLRAPIWEVNHLTFKGAAVLYKNVAAYKQTSFRIKRGILCLSTL